MDQEVCTRARISDFRYDGLFFVLGLVLLVVADCLEGGYIDAPGRKLLTTHLFSFVGAPSLALMILWPSRYLIRGYRWLRRRRTPALTPAWWPVSVALFALAVHLLTEVMQLWGGFVDRRPHPAGWQDEVINFIARHQGVKFDPVDVALLLLAGGLTLYCLAMSRRTHIRAGNPPVW